MFTSLDATAQSLSFQADPVVVKEADGPAMLTVNLAPGSTGAVTVKYTTQGGTATAGEDYTSASGTLTFMQGDTSKTIEVTITDDTHFDGKVDEHFEVLLSNASSGATLPDDPSAAVHIVDDDSPPEASMTDVTVGEGDGTMTLTLKLSGTSDEAISYVATPDGVSGSAEPADYHNFFTGNPATATVTVEAFALTGTFPITIVDDAENEIDENIKISWAKSESSQSEPDSLAFVGTITDNDASDDATLSKLNIDDQDDNQVLLDPFFRSEEDTYTADVASLVSQVSVTLTTTDLNATVEYLDGSDNAIPDADAKHGHQVDLVDGANIIKIKVTAEDGTTTQTYTVTVNRVAALPTVSIESAAQSAVFRSAAASWTLKLAEPMTDALDVKVELTQERNFLPASALTHTVTIPSNSAEATLTIPASDFQAFPAGVEVAGGALTATVQPEADYQVDVDASASVDIVIGLTVGFEVDADTVGEAAGPLQIILVARTGDGAEAPSSAGSYRLETVSGEAVSPDDYEHLSQGFDFSDFVVKGTQSEAEHSVDVTIVDDATPEGDETFVLRLSVDGTSPAPLQYANLVDASGKSCGSRCDFTVTITDDDDQNTAPTFTEGPNATRTFDETLGDAAVTTATDIGDPVAATDADGHSLTYSLEGTDAAGFTIVPSSGQIRTKVGEKYDFEAKASYAVTVGVEDDNGGSATIAVTLNVADQAEVPPAPGAPTVTATPGSTTALDVTWTAPDDTGRPAIDGYDLQYREGTSGSFTDGPQGVTGTSASISGLTAGTSYEVQVRATNAEGVGAWSASGTGATAPASTDATLSALALTGGDGNTVDLNETFAPATLTYTANTASKVDKITIVPTTTDDGATVAYFDGDGVALTDADLGGAFQVALTEGANTISIEVTAEDANTTRTYVLTVTRTAANSPPVFTDASVTFDFDETVGSATEPAARDIGTPYLATDADGDELTYSLEGADAARFEVDAMSAQIRTKAGERYDFEAGGSLSLTLKAADATGSDTVAVGGATRRASGSRCGGLRATARARSR